MEENEKLQQLESRMAARPNSPLFARLAELLLQNGENARAIELCENGMKVYPEYTTGFLVAARCYSSAGQTQDAERVLRYILQHHTRHSTAFKFLEEIKNAKNDGAQLQSEHAKAFDAYAERMRAELSGSGNPLSIEEFLSGAETSTAPADSSIEALAQSLKGAKIQPAPEPPAPAQREAQSGQAPPPDPAIASATLAEIYEKQGQYAEAIATYKLMLGQNPAERNRYEQRIEALQQLLDSRAFGL